MESNNSNIFFDFPSFLKEDGDLEHEEIDKACLSHELFQDSNCLKTLLPLYFFLTRNGEEKMSVAKLKKTFRCGAELIRRVRKAIEEKKPLQVPGRKITKPVRNDETLIGLVDAMTRENGGLSDSTLATILGTSQASINRIRHDLSYSYKPLRHGPHSIVRHVGARLEFCLIHQNDDWSKVLFTDESRFSTSPDCPVMWWVKRGTTFTLKQTNFPSP